MNKITITVEGPAGSGKTAISDFITKTLNERGFDVTYRDPDALHAHTIRLPNNNALNDILRKCEVVIEEKQQPRYCEWSKV